MTGNKPSLLESRIGDYKVLLRPTMHNEIVALGIFSPHGASRDPAGKSGTLNLAQNVMQKGAGDKNALELAEAIEDLGGSIGGSSSLDFSKFALTSSTLRLDETLGLMAEMIASPRFDADEIEKERELQIADVRLSDDSQFHYTNRHLLEALYGDHPYSRLSDGTPESLKAITREDLLAAHDGQFGSPSGVVTAVGNFDPDKLAARLERILPAPASSPASPGGNGKCPTNEVNTAWPSPGRIELSKACEQAFLCAGFRTVPMNHADYPALRLLSALLGEGMGGRMFLQLRDEMGLAYATGCAHVPHRGMSHLLMYIGTNPDRIAESEAGFAMIADQAKAAPPSAGELDRARNYVLGSFLFDHQKNSRQAHYLGYFEMMGLGCEMDAVYPDKLNAVTPDMIHAVAQKYLIDPTTAVLIPEKPGS